jgi:hypothetical protein
MIKYHKKRVSSRNHKAHLPSVGSTHIKILQINPNVIVGSGPTRTTSTFHSTTSTSRINYNGICTIMEQRHILSTLAPQK